MTQDNALYAFERQRHIVEILQREGTVRTAELSDLLKVSVVTIRSDLRELEKAGECEIVWGGAVSKIPPANEVASPEHKTRLNYESKQRIGKKAAEFIEVGQTIILDAGTTTIEIINYLPGTLDYLRIITPALNVAVATIRHPYIELIMPGGVLRNLTRSLLGLQTVRMLEMFNADTLFLSCSGFDIEHGITSNTLAEAEVKRTMVQQARKVILVADASKFGRILSLNVAPITAVDTLISDILLSDSDTQILTEQGLDVLRV